MKKEIFALLIVLFSLVNAQAERELEKTEIIDIFTVLTEQPRNTWINFGTMQAKHYEYKAPATIDEEQINQVIEQKIQEYRDNTDKPELTEDLQRMKLDAIPFNTRYKLSNEYIMNSTELVRYDGERFYWEINVAERVDSLAPTSDLAGNYITEEFDLKWNRTRVFAWDGEKYVQYYRPGNQAIITELLGSVNGLLTAGIIPWGVGRLSYEHLINTEFSALEVESNGRSEIQLVIKDETAGYVDMISLDAENLFNIIQWTIISDNTYQIDYGYSNYRLFKDNFCPMNIIIQKYDISTTTPRLLSEDKWEYTIIEPGQLDVESFTVDYEYDAIIEDYRNGEKLQYRYAPPLDPEFESVNIDELVQERLEIAALLDENIQNCATVSLKYVCNKLGINPSWDELSSLIKGQERTTSLLAMQNYIRDMGFDSLTVKTDIDSLKSIKDKQVILHLQSVDHYVVLGDIDDKYVRLIDLDRNNFYYRDSVEYFSKIWDGTALIVDDKLIKTDGYVAKINSKQLSEIVGASTCTQCYVPLQYYAYYPCSYSGFGSCSGEANIVFNRTGCGSAQSGSCEETSGFIDYVSSEYCYYSAKGYCIGGGTWTAYGMYACK